MLHIDCPGLCQHFARFVYEVVTVYPTVPVFVPAQNLFEGFPDLPVDNEEGEE